VPNSNTSKLSVIEVEATPASDGYPTVPKKVIFNENTLSFADGVSAPED
jgi:hypothetical protein